MKRVAVIGYSGSGKSTFSKKLAAATGIPLIHLDQLFWLPGWIPMERDIFILRLMERLNEDSWITDGNFTNIAPQRFARTDTVFFFDFPLWKCLIRLLKRICSCYGKIRDDMAEGCPERFNLKFLYYVARLQKPSILKALEENAKHCNVIRFTTSLEADRWIKNNVSH